MGCGYSTNDEHLQKVGYTPDSPELRKLLVTKQFKRAGEIVHKSLHDAKEKQKVLAIDEWDQSNALHWAAGVYGSFDILSWLIEEHRGFRLDVNMRNIHGDTALHIAIRKNNPDSVRILMRQMKHFSDPLPVDADGHTALHLAMYLNRHEILEHLVSEDGKWDKFNPDGVLDKYGRVPIFAGIETDSVQAVKTIVSKFHANPEAPSRPLLMLGDDDEEEEDSGSSFCGMTSTNTNTTAATHETEILTLPPPRSSLTSPNSKKPASSNSSGGSLDDSPKAEKINSRPYHASGEDRPFSGSRHSSSNKSNNGGTTTLIGLDVEEVSLETATTTPSNRSFNSPPLSSKNSTSHRGMIAARTKSAWGDEPVTTTTNCNSSPKEPSPLGGGSSSSLPSAVALDTSSSSAMKYKLDFPHKLIHGTKGEEFQTPLEFAKKIQAKRCILFLEGLFKRNYGVRRSLVVQNLENANVVGNYHLIQAMTKFSPSRSNSRSNSTGLKK